MGKFKVPFVDTDTLPTKEIFYIFPDAATGAIGDYATADVSSGADAALTGFIPHDFTTLVEMSLVIITGGINVNLSWTTDYAAAGEVFNTHSGAGGFGIALVPNVILELPLVGEFANLAAMDYFGVLVTVGGVLETHHLLGVRVRYL